MIYNYVYVIPLKVHPHCKTNPGLIQIIVSSFLIVNVAVKANKYHRTHSFAFMSDRSGGGIPKRILFWYGWILTNVNNKFDMDVNSVNNQFLIHEKQIHYSILLIGVCVNSIVWTYLKGFPLKLVLLNCPLFI